MKARPETTAKTKAREVARQVYGADSRGPSVTDDCSREQMIAEAAYFRAEQRGFVPGNEMSDWLLAEAEVEGVLRGAQ